MSLLIAFVPFCSSKISPFADLSTNVAFVAMIEANTRARLTADDFDFILKTLSLNVINSLSLEQLLLDEESLNLILDHDALADAILNSPERLSISPSLLFYVLCRKVLRNTPVNSRESADYIAAVLTYFSSTPNLQSLKEITHQDLCYLSDMLLCLQDAPPRQAFILRVHIGNYTLFLSGLLHQNLKKRSLHGGPSINFYEQMGQANFEVAADSQEAHTLHLDSIYHEIGAGFREARLALNDLADRLLHLN